MTMNPLPPQAYTKEILLKAYQWLMSQNSSIKEIATTPDILVSLYLKATRDGDSALERPSIQNFKNELKSLAGLMGELDRPNQSHMGATAAGPATMSASASMATMTATAHTAPTMAHGQMTLPHQNVAPTPAVQPQTHQVSYTEKTVTATTSRPAELLEAFDCGTRLMIQEVKEEFNLSSDLEALRMLIKIGYVKAKGMLK